MKLIKQTPSLSRGFTFLMIMLFMVYLYFFSSCTSTPTQPEEEEQEQVKTIPFTNAEYNIHLEYPVDWFFKTNDGLLFSTVSSFDLATDRGAGLAILRYPEKDVQTEFKNPSLPDLIKAVLSEIKGEFQEIETIMIGEWEAKKADFTITGETLLAGEIIICHYKQYYYVFMAITNPGELMKEYKRIFSTIYGSIEFNDNNGQ